MPSQNELAPPAPHMQQKLAGKLSAITCMIRPLGRQVTAKAAKAKAKSFSAQQDCQDLPGDGISLAEVDTVSGDT